MILCVDQSGAVFTDTSVDIYGEFDPARKMFVDKGWLLDDVEIHLRLYDNPVTIFQVTAPHRVYTLRHYVTPYESNR